MKHVFGLVYCRMADFGEVMDAIGHMHSADEDGWADAWIAAGKRLEKRAASAEERKKLYSAGEEYLRASSYYRIGLMYFSKPEDHRMKEYARRSHGCYEKYLKLSGYPGEYVRIPYEGTYLPGHFYRSPSAGEKAPLLILTPGRDTWGEDTRWVYDAALKRGIHCLVYDGPGQGFALRLQGLPFRPDWENVVTPVVDFACTLPGIDTDRIGIMGISFGGFLIPRAVAFEKRIKLCMVLVYKSGQEKLNNLYYQVKEQRRCSTWRRTRNLTLRNSSSRLWICTMPEEPRIHNSNVNMA